VQRIVTCCTSSLVSSLSIMAVRCKEENGAYCIREVATVRAQNHMQRYEAITNNIR
jgi:hypothetical protein